MAEDLTKSRARDMIHGGSLYRLPQPARRMNAMHLHDPMEPEGKVGEPRRDTASRIGGAVSNPEAGVSLASVRPSLDVLFRALGGGAGVELTESTATLTRHRRPVRREPWAKRDREHVARYDGACLALPPFLAVFPERDLNRAAYFWLTALAAVSDPSALDLPGDGPARDRAQIRANAAAADRAYAACPGLRDAYSRMAGHCLAARPDILRPAAEAAIEQAVRDELCGTTTEAGPTAPSPDHLPFATVPIWLEFRRPGAGGAAAGEALAGASPPPDAATRTRKPGEGKDIGRNRRSFGFIIHRFESILSWDESMNRSVQDDDENARKAAGEQDRIKPSRHDRKTAKRLRGRPRQRVRTTDTEGAKRDGRVPVRHGPPDAFPVDGGGPATGVAPMTRTGWNRRRIALALYPFGAGAMAVSVFFASLTGPWIGLPVLSTLASILIGAVIGWPAAWWLAGHVSGLTDETDP